jgi:alkanesulfonate monooxygenase SsuD/methylene tetrahydromethanopterin reductase-like flavin-dependent oxidoreductase (luciferase family)
MISQEQIDNWFTYHSPTPEQQVKYVALRDTAKAFAKAIVSAAPDCADTTAAVRKVREAVMTANQAIACGGK